MALLPIFNPVFTAIAALLVMTPLLVGFVRDWLVVSCRIEIDGNQQTILDHWAGRILTRYLPLLLRLGILAVGIVLPAVNDAVPGSFFLAGCAEPLVRPGRFGLHGAQCRAAAHLVVQLRPDAIRDGCSCPHPL